MKKNLIIFVLLFCSSVELFAQTEPVIPAVTMIRLPEPDLNGRISLEQAIKNRRSIRQFTIEPLKINQIGQLCWSAQGITEPNKGLRAAPSAGALYPIQLYVVLPDGLYLYSPQDHSLEKKINGDIRPMLSTAAFGQRVVQSSPCTFVISGSVRKLEAKYRGKGEKFAYLEAGHIAQNIHLQAVTLGLGSVPLGAFDPKAVAGICKLTEDLEVLYLVCTGNPIIKPALEPAVAAPPAVTLPVRLPSDIRTKRVVIVVPNKYFSDAEFFDIEDTLQTAGIQPVIASLVIGEIKGVSRNVVTSDMLVKDIKVDDYDAFIFIGGPGIRGYLYDKDSINLVRQANEKYKILAAINNAPAIFVEAGIVKGRTVTSFTAQRRKFVDAGAKWKNTSLEIDGNIITASGPDDVQISAGGISVAQRFGTAIVRMLRQPPVPRPPSSETSTPERNSRGGSQMY
jgi:SagB-type dehydrogenase family enzyme